VQSLPRLQLRNSASQHRKINCTLQIALVEKAAWVGCEVLCGVGALKVCSKLGLSAKPATPPTPQPQHRKINCTLQNAVAEKSA